VTGSTVLFFRGDLSMQIKKGKLTQFTPMAGVFFLLLMAVFETELTVMQLLGEISVELTLTERAVLDASLLIIVVALPLWFFVFSPTLRKKIKNHESYLKLAISLYIRALIGLFLIQFLVMLSLPTLVEITSFEAGRLLDSSLTVVLSAPLFWWLLYRLEMHLRIEPLADLVTAPQTLFVLLLYMIFLADLMQELIFAQLRLDLSYTQYQLLDAFFTIVLIAPLLYILVVRPLRLLALTEKARVDFIYDQVVDAIIKVDVKGEIESFNAAAQRIFGFLEAEMRGKSANLLLNSDQINIKDELKKLSDYKHDEVSLFYDLTSTRFDGSPLNLDLSISKVLLQGPVEYLLIVRDTTQRKEAEEALLASNAIFREIFDQTEDAIIFFKPGGGEILDVNVTTEELYGYSKSELRTLGAEAFCDAETYSNFRQFLTEVEQEGQAQIEQMHNRNKAGETLITSIRGKKMNLPDSSIIYTTVRDISDRVQFENESREIQAKLIMANKMTSLGLMVSGVAHEINNPNNYMLANTQLFGKIWGDTQKILRQYYNETGDFMLGGIPFRQLEEQAPKLLLGLADGSHRITAIVNNLKRFARRDTTLICTDVDINNVVTSAISLLHHELIKYTNNFNFDLAEDLPLIEGSIQQLGQVVINLLMNACQALPDKKLGVELTTRYDHDTETVLITVSDQGAGLPEELKDKIFTPFFSTKLETGGTGLGLAISMSIIKDHGGSLDYISTENVGTTFTVKLPIQQTSDK
jgi:PAS domain S-box-containing protein